jgi:hypothetical protein
MPKRLLWLCESCDAECYGKPPSGWFELKFYSSDRYGGDKTNVFVFCCFEHLEEWMKEEAPNYIKEVKK